MFDMTKNFKIIIIVLRFVPSSLTNHKILEVTLNLSSKTFICFINLAPIVSLASKRPTHTWRGSHCGGKKLIRRAKVSHAHLFIHKSNVVVVVGVTSKNGVTYSSKHFSTIIKRISSFITFKKGKQLLDLVVTQGITSKDFHNCLKEKKPWL